MRGSSPPFAKPWYQFNSLNKANSAFIIPVGLTNYYDHISTDNITADYVTLVSGDGEEEVPSKCIFCWYYDMRRRCFSSLLLWNCYSSYLVNLLIEWN